MTCALFTAKKKKVIHAYLLLELLIALTLVTTFLVPFLSLPFLTIKEELLSLQRMQLQHIGDRSFALVKEHIYKKEISWEQLTSPRNKKFLAIHDRVFIPVKEVADQSFERKCYVYSSGKKDQNNKEHRIITVEVFLKKIANRSFFTAKKQKTLKFRYKIYLAPEDAKI